jgi:hypothetical protein
MIQLSFLPAQITTGDILEIVGLLLVAGIIAWLTSYYYYRSIYRKKIAERDEIIKTQSGKIRGLEADIYSLQASLQTKDQEIEKLKLDLANVKKANKPKTDTL